MKFSKTMLAFMALGAIGIMASGCGPKQDTTGTTTTQEATVGRGDLSVDITAAGNLALSVKEDLAFDIPGTVQDVLVEEGDSVTKDQVLARLDTSEWDKQMNALTRQVTNAQRQVTATQKTLRDKQNAVTSAQNQLTSKQFSLRQAQLDLQSAQDAVNQTVEIKKIQDQIDGAQEAIDLANRMLASGADFFYWNGLKRNSQDSITQSNKDMKALLAGTSTTVSSNVALDISRKQLTVEQRQFGITQAQFDFDNAKLAVEDAQNAIAPAQEDVQNAQDDLKTAQQNLDDAKIFGPEVKAPFDGFVTKVSVKGGDDVKKGTVAVTVADPNKFEADVLVNETDIANVRLGGLASVELQAEPGTTLTANVTHISPTATVQQGVVNYKVTVEVGTVRQAAQLRGGSFGSGNFSPGDLASVRQTLASGNLTDEQINQLIQQRQQAGGGQFTFRGGSANLTSEQRNQLAQQRQQGAGPGGQGGAFFSGEVSPEQVQQFLQQGQAQPNANRSQLSGRVASSAGLRLAEGMTVNVSIPVDSRTNVVVVPNSAITTSGGQASVKVLKADGTTEQRAIQTGIADYQNTEVLSGLTDGEKVVITRKTSSSSASSGTSQGNTIRVPGGGGGGFFQSAR